MRRAVLVLIIALFVLCFGCQKENVNLSSENGTNNSQLTFENTVWFEVAELNYTFSQEQDWNAKEIVCSKLELDALTNKHNINTYAEKYNNEYFLDRALIVYLFSQPHFGADYSVVAVQSIEHSIVINLIDNAPNGNYYAQALTFWVCIIEIESTNIDAKSNLIVNFIKEN